MQRVLIEKIIDSNIFLNEEDVFHFKNVLRMKENEEFEGVYQNKLYLCYVKKINPFALSIRKELPSKGELTSNITLYFVLSKGEKNELVTQKCTELGVGSIYFLTSERCIVIPKDFTNKKERLEKIALSAFKQSRRMNVPKIEGVKSILNLTKEDLKDHNYFAYETISGTTKEGFDEFNVIKKGESISILIGPEGGISPKEAEHLLSLGFIPVSLGSRILRSETAAIASLSVLSFFVENL